MNQARFNDKDRVLADLEKLRSFCDRIRGPSESQRSLEEIQQGALPLKHLKNAVNGPDSPSQSQWARTGGFDPTTFRRMAAGRIQFGTLKKVVGALQELGKFHPRLDPCEFVVTVPKVSLNEGKADVHQLDASSRLSTRTSRFVGRNYAFDFVGTFMAENEGGYIVVEGAPGMGKSSLLAECARRWNAPSHFNVRSMAITSLQQLIDNLAPQFCNRFGWKDCLAMKQANHGQQLELLLEQASSSLGNGAKLLVVIDALDESNYSPDENPLCLPKNTPTNVFLLVSRRLHTAPLEVETNIGLLDLSCFSEENRRDAQAFLMQEAARTPRFFPKSKKACEKFVGEILNRSDSNFMYLHYVINDIRQGRIKSSNLKDLPVGLLGYYERHLRRMLTGDIDKNALSLIYVLAEIAKPVTVSLLSQFVAEDEVTVSRLLEKWAQFLEINRLASSKRPVKLYRLYHQSFADFLMDKDTIQSAKVDIEQVRRNMMDNMLERFTPS